MKVLDAGRTARNGCWIAVACSMLVSALALALDPVPGGTTNGTSEPPPCGDQGKDNRPNWCGVKIGGVWTLQKSSCQKLGDGTFVYTHCSGSTLTIPDQQDGTSHSCCTESSECPGAYYVAQCLNN